MVAHSEDEEAIFCEALQASSPAEKRAILAAACGENHQLRDRVEALLAAHDTDDAFLQTPAAMEAEKQHPAAPGTVIGRYELLELIGEGGFGDVYMAEQQEPVRRQVALKIIKLGMDTRAVIARFEAERQALALMDHPNIAKVFDAGATETGRPYFVMDLVRGCPITEYCDSNNLSTRERLRLFIDVCQAVQHAHQKGIIHRDIKPTNVLVTQRDGRPVPKIIDFGVAKATQHRLTEKTHFTEHRQLVGTPEYMSPEQATFGEADVDTRSDVYSLGVVLYELLVGTTPFDAEALHSRGYDEICRVIRESDPPTPSKRLSTLGDAEVTDISEHRHADPAALRKLFRGDLDWIVMKCLEKDRTRRYETAHGLARDIQRHLNDEPVHARPPSLGYRVKKFVRRYRTSVVATAVVLAVVLTALSVGLVRERRLRAVAQQERNRAGENLRRAQQVVDELLTRFSTHPDFRGRPRTRQLRTALLERACDYYRSFIQQEPRDPALRQALAEVSMRLGGTCLELGKVYRPDKALPAYQEAINIFRRLAKEKPTDVDLQIRLADAYNASGNVQMFTANYDRAEAAYARVLQIAQRLEKTEAAAPAYRKMLGGTYCNLGQLAGFRGQHHAALEWYRQACQLLNEVPDAVPEKRGVVLFLCRVHGGRGAILLALSRRDAAIEAYERALELVERLIRDNPSDMEYARECAAICSNLGALYGAHEDWDRAVGLLERAMAIGERLADDNPALPSLAADLGGTYCHMAVVMFDKGDMEAAQSFNRKARTTLGKVLQAEPKGRGALFLSRSLGLEADIWQRLGRGQDALGALQRAASVLDQLVEEDPATAEYALAVAGCYRSLGQLCSELHRWDEAHSAYEHSVELREALLRRSPQNVAHQVGLGVSFYNMGVVYEALGRREDCERAYRRAIEILARPAEDGSRDARRYLSLAHTNLGVFYQENGKLQEALWAHEQARELQEGLAEVGEESAELATQLGGTYCNLGNLASAQDELERALAWYDRAITTLGESLTAVPQLPSRKQFLVNALRGRAMAYDRLRRHAEAVNDWRRAARIDAQNDGLRFQLAASLTELARSGNHRQAAQSAATVEADSTGAAWRYNLACVYSLAVAAAAQDRALADEVRKRLMEEYGAQALRQLQSIQERGEFSAVGGRKHLEKDQDLDAIRTREDFRALIEQLRQGPPVPPGEGAPPGPEETGL